MQRLCVLLLTALYCGPLFSQIAGHPVISEIRYDERSGLAEEFVELYNPTGEDIPLEGWTLSYKSATGSKWYRKAIFESTDVIRAFGFYLIGGSDVEATPDFLKESALGLGNNGGHAALFHGEEMIDCVAWESGDSPEGASAVKATEDGGSIERKAKERSTASSMEAGGTDEIAGNGFDSNSNADDFVLHESDAVNPQNSRSPVEEPPHTGDGTGIIEMSPSIVEEADTVSLKLKIEGEMKTPVVRLAVIFPNSWQWLGAIGDLECDGVFSGCTVSVSTDTLYLSGFQLGASQTGSVVIPCLLVQNDAGETALGVLTASEKGILTPVSHPPVITVQPAGLADSPDFLIPPAISEWESNSVMLVFSTDVPSGYQVHIGVDVLSDEPAAESSEQQTEHQIRINHLQPATIYQYQVEISNSGGRRVCDPNYFITASHESSTGEMNVYFSGSVDQSLAGNKKANGEQDLKDRLVQRIEAARYSIDGCFMKLTEWDIRDALIEAVNRGVHVRFICDDGYVSRDEIADMQAAGITVISDAFGENTGETLMHHKFAVFDHRDDSAFNDDWVWTGSYNLTYYGESPAPLENAIEIQDEALAEIYTCEFEEMWGSGTDTPDEEASRFGQRKLHDTPNEISIAGTTIGVYMSPSDGTADPLIQVIQSADHTCYFCMFAFTSDTLSRTLVAQYESISGFQLRGVFDRDQVEDDEGYSEWPFLSQHESGPDVLLDGYEGLLHHKYVIIDSGEPDSDPVASTGSYNWSASGEWWNDENCLIIHSADVANQFLQEFAERYREAGGKGAFTSTVKSDEVSGPSLGLLQNYPNPFNQSTIITFQLQYAGFVSLNVVNLMGQRAASIIRKHYEAGSYQIQWNGCDDSGHPLASGLYHLLLRQGENVHVIKILLLR